MEKKVKDKHSFIIGIGIVCFCFAVLFYFTPHQIEYYQKLPGTGGLTGEFFPNIVTILLFICSVILIFQSLRSDTQEKTDAKFVVYPRVLILGGIFIAYVALLDYLGFLIITPVFLVGAMVLLGARDPVKIILSTIISISALYYLFNSFLRLLLPAGRFLS